MKTLLLASIFCVVVYGSAQNAFTQQRQASRTTIQEVKSEPANVAAPRETLSAFRDFFGYLQKHDTNISREAESLSQYLREK